MSAHHWTILADGTHVVDPQGWTIAKFYGDDADEHARIAVAAVNSHARLLAAAKEVQQVLDPWPRIHGHDIARCIDHLQAAIAAAEELKP